MNETTLTAHALTPADHLPAPDRPPAGERQRTSSSSRKGSAASMPACGHAAPAAHEEWPEFAVERLSALAAGEDLVARLRLAMIRLTRQLRRADPAGLSVAAVSALTTIALRGQMTLGELAEAERLQSPSVTRIVDRLEEAGLVRRVPCLEDRRIIRAVATEAGHRVLEERWCEGNAFLAERIAGLDSAEQESLHSTVGLLEALVGESRPGDPLDALD
jgi:DNA-binding MarR family transcriptional regulator